MTDNNTNDNVKANKAETRKKILGELESIKHLLTEEERALAPLLTDPAAPLLTEAIDDHELDNDWDAGDLESIPVLEDPLDGEYGHDDHEPVDSHATAGDHGDRGPIDAKTEAHGGQTPEPAENGDWAEDQPGLFDSADLDGGPVTSSDSSPEPAQSSSASQDAPSMEAAKAASTQPKSENPFLPKHIRDRLQANRLMQQEMIKSFAMEPGTLAGTQPNATPAAPPVLSSGPSSAAISEAAVESETNSPPEHLVQALVEDILQRHLPLMEAELREKLLELANNSAESATDGEDSV